MSKANMTKVQLLLQFGQKDKTKGDFPAEIPS